MRKLILSEQQRRDIAIIQYLVPEYNHDNIQLGYKWDYYPSNLTPTPLSIIKLLPLIEEGDNVGTYYIFLTELYPNVTRKELYELAENIYEGFRPLINTYYRESSLTGGRNSIKYRLVEIANNRCILRNYLPSHDVVEYKTSGDYLQVLITPPNTHTLVEGEKPITCTYSYLKQPDIIDYYLDVFNQSELPDGVYEKIEDIKLNCIMRGVAGVSTRNIRNIPTVKLTKVGDTVSIYDLIDICNKNGVYDVSILTPYGVIRINAIKTKYLRGDERILDIKGTTPPMEDYSPSRYYPNNAIADVYPITPYSITLLGNNEVDIQYLCNVVKSNFQYGKELLSQPFAIRQPHMGRYAYNYKTEVCSISITPLLLSHIHSPETITLSFPRELNQLTVLNIKELT